MKANCTNDHFLGLNSPLGRVLLEEGCVYFLSSCLFTVSSPLISSHRTKILFAFLSLNINNIRECLKAQHQALLGCMSS